MATTRSTEGQFTRAQLDKVVRLRKQGVPWDGEKGVCARIGVKSAIPVRDALRAAGGKYAEIVPAKPTKK